MVSQKTPDPEFSESDVSNDDVTVSDEDENTIDSDQWEKGQYSAIDLPVQGGVVERKLGTYLGVYRPTILTLFGVIMYIRMGWVVGHAGLLGALAILALTFLITGTAALALSSISTNIRLQAGGVFALVSQSLGLEAGGAIGVPVFLAQSMGAALYIYGFSEGWAYLFPEHPRWMVVVSLFAFGTALSFISERLVLRLQVIVLVGVVVALASMLGGFLTAELHEPKLWGQFEGGSIWVLFAIFFPAATGIKVGASLSGKLKEPRVSIPIGIMSAWLTAFITYAVLIVWYASTATPDELTGNYMIATEKAVWGPAVVIGLLSSCTSAMLASMVAAPNILAALAKHRIVPFGSYLTPKDEDATPRKATLVNACIVGGALLLGDLNAVAQLITMFFLITYATLNLVVLVEQSLGLVSFRPTFRVPIWVPVAGAAASVFAMIITNPVFGLVALTVVVSIYVYLERRHLDTPWETVRSGIFLALADWAARQTQRQPGSRERAWKPDVLMPIESEEHLHGDYRMLTNLFRPKGSLQVMLRTDDAQAAVPRGLTEVIAGLQKENLYATISSVHAKSVGEITRMATNVLKDSFFRPNILFLNTDGRSDDELNELIALARAGNMGVALLALHPTSRLGRERDVNIWVRDQSPEWTLGLRLSNLDLALLLGYQLSRNWGGALRLHTAVNNADHADEARTFLTRLVRDARLPHGEVHVTSDAFFTALKQAEHADLNIFGLSEAVSVEQARRFCEMTRSSCLFVLDSGHESALA